MHKMQKPSVRNLNMCNNVYFSCHFIAGMTVWQPSRMSAWRVCSWGNALNVGIWPLWSATIPYGVKWNATALPKISINKTKKPSLVIGRNPPCCSRRILMLSKHRGRKKTVPPPEFVTVRFSFFGVWRFVFRAPSSHFDDVTVDAFLGRAWPAYPKKILPPSPLPFSQKNIYIQSRRENDQ